jgi:hypothetical protein
MSFDDLQAKWKEHDHGVQLIVDVKVLLNEVRRNHRALGLQLWQRDVNEIAAAALITCVLATLAVLMGQWTLLLCAAGSLFVGLFFILDRVKQRRRRSSVECSLHSTVDASIEQVQHQIWLLRNVLWWYLLPLVPGIVLFLASASWQSRGSGLGEQLVIAGVASICAIAFWLVYRANQREITRTLEPRRVELEELRASLSSTRSESTETSSSL